MIRSKQPAALTADGDSDDENAAKFGSAVTTEEERMHSSDGDDSTAASSSSSDNSETDDDEEAIAASLPPHPGRLVQRFLHTPALLLHLESAFALGAACLLDELLRLLLLPFTLAVAAPFAFVGAVVMPAVSAVVRLVTAPVRTLLRLRHTNSQANGGGGGDAATSDGKRKPRRKLPPVRAAAAPPPPCWWRAWRRRDVLAALLVYGGGVGAYAALRSGCGLRYSVLYHAIRSASMIKLYVVFGMLQLFDHLLRAFVFDACNVLHITTTATSTSTSNRRYGWALTLGAFAAAATAVGLHAVVLLLHVATLNIAVNSEGNLLMTMLLSNNIMRLKGVLYKKFTVETLYQAVLADAAERAQYVVIVVVLLLQHAQAEADRLINGGGSGAVPLMMASNATMTAASALNSTESASLWSAAASSLFASNGSSGSGGAFAAANNMASDMLLILLAEVAVDFAKHLFVARFNGVPLDAFRGFAQAMKLDVAAEAVLWRLRIRSVDVSSSSSSSSSKSGSATTTADSSVLQQQRLQRARRQLLRAHDTFHSRVAHRSGVSMLPYAALVAWSAWPLLLLRSSDNDNADGASSSPSSLLQTAAIVALLVVVLALTRAVCRALVVGASLRFVVRTLLRVAPSERRAKVDDHDDAVAAAAAASAASSLSGPLQLPEAAVTPSRVPSSMPAAPAAATAVATRRRSSFAARSESSAASDSAAANGVVGISPQPTPMKFPSAGRMLPSAHALRAGSFLDGALLASASSSQRQPQKTAAATAAPATARPPAQRLHLRLNAFLADMLAVEPYDLNGKAKNLYV